MLHIPLKIMDLGALCVELWLKQVLHRILVPMSYISWLDTSIPEAFPKVGGKGRDRTAGSQGGEPPTHFPEAGGGQCSRSRAVPPVGGYYYIYIYILYTISYYIILSILYSEIH